MTKEDFSKNAPDLQTTLEQYEGAFAGQLIEIAVGQDELRTMFDNHPDFQEDEYDGMPSMKIAQKLGIISDETADALLVLQAGVRMAYNAQKMNKTLKGEEVETIKIDKHSVDFMNGDLFDARFKALKFGGSDQVVDAQASYAMSQVVLNEIVADKEGMEQAPDAFAKYGAELITQAAKQLASESTLQEDIAKNVQDLAAYVTPANVKNVMLKPISFAFKDITDALHYNDIEFKELGRSNIPEPKLIYFIEENTRKKQAPHRTQPANPFNMQ
jgi:hypothetical protein